MNGTEGQIALRLKEPRFNVYRCEGCDALITTVDIHEGVTPFMIACRDGNPKSVCRGTALSSFYPKGPIPAHIPFPTLEWYRPTDGEFTKLSTAMQDHVRKGGLDMRPVSASNLEWIKAGWTKQRSAARAEAGAVREE